MEVEQNSDRVIERPGKDNINVKLADNTGKKAETAKRARPRRRVRRFRNTLGRKNYTGNRMDNRRQRNNNSNLNRRRQRGVGFRRRGVRIIVRNLTRNATNSDIKALFERVGPLRRCGINYNNLGESRGTATVEYLYRADAFRACRRLDYKSIKGVPIRLEVREGLKRLLVNRLGDRRIRSTGARRFRLRNSFNRKSNNSERRNRSYSKRNSSRRGLRNRSGRRDGSRNERRYRNYNN